MVSFVNVILSIALTVLAWGMYGPTLHVGQHDMDGSRMRPFICVGIAYFAIAVVVPYLLMYFRGEKGSWTVSGTIWSFMAGAVGALGALGIILAFAYGGKPVFVMPLVFGCAPVVNTFFTMAMSRTWKDVSPIFFVGLVLVATGAAGVLIFKPKPVAKPHAEVTHSEGAEAGDAPTAEESAATPAPPEDVKVKVAEKIGNSVLVGLSIAMTALCWGAYGPVLHKGQVKMQGSRMRPLICVGLAYFLVAVIVPVMLLGASSTIDQGGWTFNGTVWSLGAGAAGAIGALGIIMAFNSGGKPVYVMPLVFGGAPVINTFTTMTITGAWEMNIIFLLSLALVIAGAVTVLVFAPKPKHGPPKAAGDSKSTPAKQPA